MTKVVRPLDCVLEQPGLSHAGFANEHTRTAQTRSGRVQNSIERGPFLIPIDEINHRVLEDIAYP